jgi:hypothetical protein
MTILSQVTNHSPTPITVLCRDGSTIVLLPDAKAVCEPVSVFNLDGPAHWSLGPPDSDLSIVPETP